jgi:peptide deformylase
MLIGQMRDTMREAPGVGLAAPQIGESARIIVIEDRPEYFASLRPEVVAERERAPIPFTVMINPEVVNTSEEVTEQPEACLSIPACAGLVTRPRSVRVKFLDSSGQLTSLEVCGWHARIIQHEIDHLNGILYIDLPGTRSFSCDAITRDLLLV